MSNTRLSSDAVQRVSGRAWDELRPLFLQVSDTLLGVSATAVGVLTTIYVKYQLEDSPTSPVFAVVWLKKSSQLVVGLAVPDEIHSPCLVEAPKGMTYRGLSRYLALQAGCALPADFRAWAEQAHANVAQQEPR